MSLEFQGATVFADGPDNVFRNTLRNFGVDFEAHLHVCSDEAREVLHHFFGDLARIPREACCVQAHRPMKPVRLRGGA